MKRRYKILIAIAIMAVIARFELLNFMSGSLIKRVNLPHGSEQLSIETDGFQDRTSYVYLNRHLRLPKLLFSFDPYRDGIYSFDISKDGNFVRFQQSNETWYVRIDDASAVTSTPPGSVSYQTLIAPTNGEDVTGTYLWGFQSLFYRQ